MYTLFIKLGRRVRGCLPRNDGGKGEGQFPSKPENPFLLERGKFVCVCRKREEASRKTFSTRNEVVPLGGCHFLDLREKVMLRAGNLQF